MLAEAPDERDSVLAELATQHEQLQSRIEELDPVQREYRDRVRQLTADQLRALDAEEWHR